jgi:hypothetical protein
MARARKQTYYILLQICIARSSIVLHGEETKSFAAFTALGQRPIYRCICVRRRRSILVFCQSWSAHDIRILTFRHPGLPVGLCVETSLPGPPWSTYLIHRECNRQGWREISPLFDRRHDSLGGSRPRTIRRGLQSLSAAAVRYRVPS